MNRSVTDIQADIDAKNAAIDQEVAMGQQANADQVNIWRMDLTTLQAELATAKAQEEAHGARVEQSRTQALSTIEKLTCGGVTLRQLCESDTGYDMAVKMVDMLTTAQAEQSSKLIQGYEERELQLQRQNVEMQKAVTFTTDELNKSLYSISDLEAKVREIDNLRNDAESKRDAAVQQLEEAKAEIKRLNDKVEEQRAEIATGVIGSIRVIDNEQQKAEMEAMAEKIKAEKTITSDIIPDRAINPLNFTVTIAATGEKKEIPYFMLKSFIVLTDPNEVEQFRTKYAEKYNVSNLSMEPTQGEVNPPVKFQPAETELQHTEDHSGTTGLAQVGQSGESQAAEQTVTRAEHEALKARVENIEKHANISAAAA